MISQLQIYWRFCWWKRFNNQAAFTELMGKSTGSIIFMAALCSRAGHYIFALWLLLLSLFFFFFPSPNLSRPRLDVYHTSTHNNNNNTKIYNAHMQSSIKHESEARMALVRIQDAGPKRAACGSLKTQDAKKSPKIAIWAPSHDFVGLYLRN